LARAERSSASLARAQRLAREARERDAKTVVGVERFNFYTFAIGAGHDGDVAVGEDAVDVEDDYWWSGVFHLGDVLLYRRRLCRRFTIRNLGTIRNVARRKIKPDALFR